LWQTGRLFRPVSFCAGTFPPLARLDLPAAGTFPGAISGRWCPALARLDLPAAGTSRPSRRWHVSTFPALVPGAISGRWHIPGRWKIISIF
jgi:hypothetical protein